MAGFIRFRQNHDVLRNCLPFVTFCEFVNRRKEILLWRWCAISHLWSNSSSIRLFCPKRLQKRSLNVWIAEGILPYEFLLTLCHLCLHSKCKIIFSSQKRKKEKRKVVFEKQVLLYVMYCSYHKAISIFVWSSGLWYHWWGLVFHQNF